MTHITSHTGDAFNRRLDEPFSLDQFTLPNRLVQAPMAGISGRAFRLQARRFGAGLTFTEMISSYGVHYANRRTIEMLELTGGEHPVAVQLFGSEPAVMAEAAAAAARAGADLIDINMGCPVRKVMKTGAGAALMRDERLAAEIVRAMVETAGIPVMAKMRSGIKGVTALSLAEALQEAGAAAICIHPRTAVQAWRGSADHTVTAALARELEIPVIASGDIECPEDATHLLCGTGAAAMMVGRAALGNPWLFEDMLAEKEPARRPLEVVLAEMGNFFSDAVGEMGPERAGRYMRKFYGWYLRPFGPPAELRAGLLKVQGFEEAEKLIKAAFGV